MSLSQSLTFRRTTMINIKNNESQWAIGLSKSITFIVTKDCQLACKYCYLVGKNEKERMSWEIAQQAIDYILDNENDPEFAYESVIWDFIGGEPFLEIDLNFLYNLENPLNKELYQ